MNKRINLLLKKYFKKKIYFVIFFLLLISLIVTRFSNLETKSLFGFDQVDNAWAVKNILVDGNLPSQGMQAKGNTGFFIGPYYYYLLVPFYFATGMDPIASPIVAGMTSIFTFFVVYCVTRSIFNEKVALVALFINVFSSYILILDRVQWPVNFIVPISFLILLSIYKISIGEFKYLLLLAISLGFSLHIHFTSIFYFIFILLAIPIVPWSRKIIKQIILSVPFFAFFALPLVVTYFGSNQGNTAANYLGNSFHGFHLRRVIQLLKDAVIESNAILGFRNSHLVSLILLPLFLFLKIYKKVNRSNLVLAYLMTIWVIVPWFAFSTYSGELTNYYFGITRPIAILAISYLVVRLIDLKKTYIYATLVITGIVYAYSNMMFFIEQNPQSLSKTREVVKSKIQKGEKVEFVQGNPESYLYFYYKELPK